MWAPRRAAAVRWAPWPVCLAAPGHVIAQAGDYSAGQVTNAADRSAANVFTHPSGQSMYQLQLFGSISGVLSVRAAHTAGTSLLIFPQGTTDFTVTGGPGQVVRQSTLGGALLVGQLALSDISGAATLCTTAVLCPGYQAALGFTPEDISNKSPSTSLGTSATLYPTQGAVKTYVDAGLAGKQAALGFTPEDSANKAPSVSLGTSNTAYPTQGAVKSYVDTRPGRETGDARVYPGGRGQQGARARVSGPVTRPTRRQNAVKVYVDTGLAGKQGALTAGAGVDITGGVIATLSTKSGFLANGGATALTCGAGTAGRMQAMANGEVQYCDGAGVPLLRAGVLTQSGLRWNVTPSSCTTDENAGKLTVNASGEVVCASDIGGTGGAGGVGSVFGRTGAVTAQIGDYTAAQVTNAADRTTANTFTHATGQTMARLTFTGATSGTLSLRPPAVAGTSILTLPAGSTDFTATGGPSQVVRQSALGAPFTVGQLALAEISGTGNLCDTNTVCAGYQAALGFTPENSANKATSPALGTSNTAYPTQGAVKSYVDTGPGLEAGLFGLYPGGCGAESHNPRPGHQQYPLSHARAPSKVTSIRGWPGSRPVWALPPRTSPISLP